VARKNIVEILQEENQSLREKQERILQISKEPKLSVIPLDIDEGLAKVMSDLNVMDIELGTVSHKLKFSLAKIT
jgi:hypothetical protein